MLRRSWSIWVFVAVATIVMAAFAIVASGNWQPSSKIFESKYAGLVGSAIVTAYGLWQALLLANRRLPSRLQEYLLRSQERITRHRNDLVTMVQGVAAAPRGTSLTILDRYRQRRHDEQLRQSALEIESEAFDKTSVYRTLQKRFDIANKARLQACEEMATAHFIRGLKFARAADAGQDTDKNRKDAIAELTKATQLDAGDAQIFRACVTERRKANQLADLDQLLGGWVDAAMGSRQRREVGIANLELGKYWSDRSVDPSLTQVELKRRLRLACYSLEAAVEDLQAHPEKDGTAGKDRALADALESAGDARAALNNHSTAHRLYWQALSIYRALVDVSAVDRVKAKIASVGGHMSDDGDGSSPPPPRLNLVNAQVQLGEALISCGENVSAQAAFNTARRTLREEVTTNELTDEHRQDINAEIDDGLKRASQNSQTA